ncbi:MAG: 2-dehydropantoate 2-reductase [Candidatus Bipolaricaulota bacterium]|nr:2-dehydropantoate 2-reductase [Candidatus Bipolaricaulota bacterium]
MRIYIVGAGALGSLFGGLLARAGAHVCLYNPSNVEHIRVIQSAGLAIERDGSSLKITVEATTTPDALAEADLVGIFVKAHQTARAMEQIAPKLNPRSWVLSLQNGVGMESEILRFVSGERFLRGVTAQGATLVGPGRVRWAGVGLTRLGRWEGPITSEIEAILALLRRAEIETEYSGEIERLLWEKIIINCAINPLTALCDQPNGVIVHDAELREVAGAVACEALRVARAHGVTLTDSEAVERVETVACRTAQNISSMLQDVRRGRPTEIDYINGAVVREGRRLQIPTPLNLLLTRLIAAGRMLEHPA